LDGISIYGDNDPSNTPQRLGVIPFEVDGMPHQLLAAILAYEGGIGVRNGCFCAHPYVLKLLHASSRRIEAYKEEVSHGSHEGLPGLIRVSFGCYNEESEVDVLIEQLERAVRGESRGEYIQDRKTGEFQPKELAQDLGRYFSLL
jgi:selenocysteine lyase/cysteine desulfurase